MKNHIPTKTANRLAIILTGKTLAFAFFSLLLLAVGIVNVRAQIVDDFNPTK